MRGVAILLWLAGCAAPAPEKPAVPLLADEQALEIPTQLKARTAKLVRNGPRAGTGTAAFFLFDGLFRLTVEPFRGDPRGPIGPLEVGELLAVAFIAASLILSLRRPAEPA